MKKKPQTDLKNNIQYRKRFSHGLRVNPIHIVFNYTFWLSIILTFIIYLNNVFLHKKYIIKTSIFKFLIDNSIDIIALSIGATGIILSAIAIVIVIFDKKQLTTIITTNDHTFEQFIFPYRYSATLWGTLAIITFMSQVINIVVVPNLFLSIFIYLWTFLIIYSILYPLYLISEIIGYIMLHAKIETSNK